MNTALVKKDLLDSMKADPKYRHAWNSENVYTGICFQIRALREQRGLSQAALGKAAKMAQERISILEDPNANTKPTLSTLLRIGDALDVGLDVRFVPYGTVIARSTETNMKDLEVPSFDEELPDLERKVACEGKTEGFIQNFDQKVGVNTTGVSGAFVPIHVSQFDSLITYSTKASVFYPIANATSVSVTGCSDLHSTILQTNETTVWSKADFIETRPN